LNEKFSPELLPHHAEIVDCMMEQLNVMQQNIDRARKADLKVSIHKMEVGLVIASYLSTVINAASTFSFCLVVWIYCRLFIFCFIALFFGFAPGLASISRSLEISGVGLYSWILLLSFSQHYQNRET